MSINKSFGTQSILVPLPTLHLASGRSQWLELIIRLLSREVPREGNVALFKPEEILYILDNLPDPFQVGRGLPEQKLECFCHSGFQVQGFQSDFTGQI